jgi:hypothetical protein
LAVLRRLIGAVAVLVILGGAAFWLTRPGHSRGSVPYRVYVTLGFHTNFYHSWRGDTPDEAGFGTDIRVVREILRMLDAANAHGQAARGYWESDNEFTLEEILPQYAPDIIAGIRKRVNAGLDEVLVAPYDNGLFGAMTEHEMRAALRWAVHNPWGSGVEDLFGSYVPIVRPQEYMFTTGAIPILASEDMRGVILAYSNYPFTAFSNFVAPLPPEQRYNPLWLRTEPNGPRTILVPAVSLGDVINFVSLEEWLLALRHLQTAGAVKRDLLLNINFDADAETWLPVKLPRALRWLPNTGGLQEYIDAVNKYEWAAFTTPGEYLRTHEPVGEMVVRQDMADGGWDGNYSWAEKAASHDLWTAIEQSRLAARRARALLRDAPQAVARRVRKQVEALLTRGRTSGFFQRIRALSTTHFGMSTPMVNEERQAVAEQIAGAALERAQSAERVAANEVAQTDTADEDLLYEFVVQDLEEKGEAAEQIVRVPVILTGIDEQTELVTDGGQPVPFSIVNVERLAPDGVAAELWADVRLAPGARRRFRLRRTHRPRGGTDQRDPAAQLRNDQIDMQLAAPAGVNTFRFRGYEIGGADFLTPFITYRSESMSEQLSAREIVPVSLHGEALQRLQRAALRATIPLTTPEGSFSVQLDITLTLPDAAPWIIADVTVAYPATPKHDLLHTVQQKLQRYLDLRWIEVAPFQLHPILAGSRAEPLRVWKHNYLDVVSHYDLDYGRINPANASIDAFNHQVTAGWVAVSDRRHGLLVGQNADALASYAFMPMRLREDGGVQRLWLNPFGSYHGHQMDYSHLGGNGLGSELAALKGSQFRPNGPSYNGRTERFSLLLAPYAGDRPPEELQAAARAFFYPSAVVYTRTPPGIEARLPIDIQRIVERVHLEQARARTGPLPVPGAFLVNPADGAVHVVWDESRDARVAGYEIAWRRSGEPTWQEVHTGRVTRHQIDQLQNGERYEFRMRAVGAGDVTSMWTPPFACTVGPVPAPPITTELRNLSPWLIARLLVHSVGHALTTW